MLCKLFHNWLRMEVKLLGPWVRPVPRAEFSSPPKITLSGEVSEKQKVTIDRIITPEEVSLFSNLTGDLNTVHSESQGDRRIVHGAFLNGLVSGVIGTRLPGNGTIVISQTLNFPNPCYAGETVEVSVEIGKVRKIVSCDYSVVNKSSRAVVLEGTAKLLFRSPKQ